MNIRSDSREDRPVTNPSSSPTAGPDENAQANGERKGMDSVERSTGPLSWRSASELSRRIARVAVVLVDAVHGNEEPDSQPFGTDLFADELEAWKELERLVADFKRASG